ncbi:transcription factor grauzone-like isoform X2 [Aedes albopictus]|nr:transcription factor grauzone-like [Aedes albopictus]KXJ73865.1 hypothetical protein RP20_CCG014870 [Aedes albopictus]
MPDCLTCAKSIDCDDQSFEIRTNKEIQNALCKHFWFGENQYLKSTICYPCWNKIEDFHRFYCEVEELHSKLLFPHVQLLEVKQENVKHDFIPEQSDELMKAEGNEEGSNESNNSSDDDDDDDADHKTKKKSSRSDMSKAGKRPRLRKNELDAVQEYVSQQLILDCDTCSKRCTTFDTLQRHSIMEHAKKATVQCCNLKFTKSYRFVDHIRFHLDPSRFVCSQCSKQCGNREALKRHTRTVHGCDLEQEGAGVIKTEGTDDEESDGEADSGDVEDGEASEEESDVSEGSNNGEDDDGNDFEQSESQTAEQTKVLEDEVEIQQYVSKNLPLVCDTCSERHETFKDLQKHSMENHRKRATVHCCNRKLVNSYRFIDHVRFHLNPDRFKCTQCPRKCPNSEALNRHVLKVHTPLNERKYPCKTCPKKFSTKCNLAKHAKIHGESDGRAIRKRQAREKDKKNEKMIAEHIALDCDTCKKKCSSFQALQKHSMDEHKKLAYVFCCDGKFNTKPRLVDHILYHLDPTRFQCKVCQKNLRHGDSLRRHIELNHAPEEAKTIKCSMCPKMFSHQKFLNVHERNHNPKWRCEICDRRFICEAMLTQHHKSTHTKELTFVCHVCAKTYSNYHTYWSHLKTHDESAKKKPQKPRVQCPLCNAWTLKMSRHMRLHSGTKTCEVCGEECKNVITYQYHMKNHETGDFICSVCGKNFKREIGLKEHMASHTGDVLYSCDFCDRTFNSNANRASHRKKAHPQQWLEDKLKKEAAKLAQASEAVQS